MTRAELYAAAKKNGALIDLSSRAKWRVTGADRIRFLNGQLSNDVRKLKPNEAIHACVLTVKGKLCSDVFISAEEDFLRIDADLSLRESLTARLERYIIADDVTIDDVTDAECLLHVACGDDPFGKFALLEAGLKYQISVSRFHCRGVDLVMPSELRENAWSSLSKAFTPLDDQLSETLRIEAGVPRWGAELDENTLPNEAGLDRDAIDYHKGCYVGQEVISRIKSVGHVNRSLRGFVSDSPLTAGMQLFESNEAAEKSVGHLTSAVWSFGLEKWAALGYLKRGIESPALEARAADGTAAEVAVKDLPLIPF